MARCAGFVFAAMLSHDPAVHSVCQDLGAANHGYKADSVCTQGRFKAGGCKDSALQARFHAPKVWRNTMCGTNPMVASIYPAAASTKGRTWTHLRAECITAPIFCICVRIQVILRTHLHLEHTVLPILRKCVTYYGHSLHFRGRTCTQDVPQHPFPAFASSYCLCAHRLGAGNGPAPMQACPQTGKNGSVENSGAKHSLGSAEICRGKH